MGSAAVVKPATGMAGATSAVPYGRGQRAEPSRAYKGRPASKPAVKSAPPKPAPPPAEPPEPAKEAGGKEAGK